MTLFVAFEILGTIAFAVSGAVVAISKKMDIFGVAILGMTTAVGGGILRDLILGITPPAAFQSPGYALTSIAVSMLVFLPPVRRLLHWNEKLYDTALLLFDAIGLGIFTVIGVQTAYIATGELNAFLAIFVGVVTGCGVRIGRRHDVRCGKKRRRQNGFRLARKRVHQCRLSAAADDGRHAAADVQKRCDLHVSALSAAVRRGARGARSSPPRC